MGWYVQVGTIHIHAPRIRCDPNRKNSKQTPLQIFIACGADKENLYEQVRIKSIDLIY